MLKNRTFLTGLGIGIMIGALLLQLMYIGEDNQQKLNNSLNGEDTKMYTQAEVDLMLAAERDSAELNAKTEDEALQAEATPSPASSDAVPSAESSEEPAVEEEPVQLQLRIQGGMNLTQTAELLKENHLIADKSAFIAKMKKTKKPVRAGYFLFIGEPTLDEVITKITSQPLTKDELAQLQNN